MFVCFVSKKIHIEDATIKHHPLCPYMWQTQTSSALMAIAFAVELTLELK